MPATVSRVVPVGYAWVLAALTALFISRVVGQALAAFFAVGFLPPMERWYSGLVPYPILLPAQAVIVAVMLKIVWDFARGSGFFVEPRPRAGAILKWLSYAYFLAMVVRYVVTMARYPELRWLTGTIPIWFHMVLAAFLYTFAHYHVSDVAQRRERLPS